MRNGSGPPYTRRGRQALFPFEKVLAWEQAGTFASLAAERAASLKLNGASGNDDLRNVEADARG
jgi:hypothetical protein